MSQHHTFIDRGSNLEDSKDFVGQVLDASPFKQMLYDVQTVAIGGGSFTVDFERSTRINGEFSVFEQTASISAVGTTQGETNSYVTEADVLGFVRAKVNSSAATGLSVTVEALFM